MKRWIVGVPIFSVVAYIAARAIVGHGDPQLLYRVDAVTVELLAGLGCLVAGVTFARGDHLRTAWHIYGAGFFALIVWRSCGARTRR